MNGDPPKGLTLAELWRTVQGLLERVEEIEDRFDKRRWTRAEVIQLLALVVGLLAVVATVYTATKGH